MQKQNNNKAELIDRLIKLVNGEITKKDLKPIDICLLIDWGHDDNGNDMSLYLLNGVCVDRDTWNRAADRQRNGTGTFDIQYMD